ncbi:putative hydrolase [Pseudonocardia sp. Ae168_Ps1]|uniref:alpha/beta fold hydrolase n=1 Tax=unclassified Pseudonocardia TaxID=2619320 RepID=UPI00094AF1B6|nr:MULTISPECIES: alpha/beta hydrolase [unclassified Pseudonocardia]OLL73442.1 putative hydrolase [Pseudonocardia sp. Ae150A_Ps1]OLL79419.1 putative hydrolase [Pseudonocardia sp. Ae168_Ps1]OLL86447.1 putative hydrolase [Pseudonocardia sp. Ae263_Ps1]OLL93512.1 putative hydrolase [Pseudonocardia sp. Ae356_Ps1]
MSGVDVGQGVRLFVQDLGAEHPGTTPLVLLPGFGMTHEVWDRQVRLAAATRRVLALDQRGHGQSDAPLDGYDLDTLVRDLVAVLDACGVSRADVVGWSFGGQVAFRAAAAHPDRVSRLVLVGSNGVRASRSDAFPFGRDAEKAERAMLDAEHADRIAARRTFIAAAFAREPRPDVLDHLGGLSLRMPSWAAVECARTMFRSDLTADLPAVTAPVLQVMGAADPVHRIEGARWLQERLADSRLIELLDCGHYPMFEAADAFDEALSGFLGL